jgi:serine/threonine protein kinase
MAKSDDREMALPDLPTRVEATVAGLKPLPPDLEPDVLRFVTELRRIFGQLEMSLGQYARLHYRDKSGLSRYFSGNRIPSRELLDELIADVTRMRGIPLTVEADSHLRQLHLDALAARDRRAYHIQVLTDQLENATTELWQTKRRIKELEDELSQRESALNDLRVGTRQLERAWDNQRERTDDELAESHERYAQLKEEYDRLQGEAEDLRSRLVQAQEREAGTRDRCIQLEQALDSIEPDISSDRAGAEHDRAADPTPDSNGAPNRDSASEYLQKQTSGPDNSRQRNPGRKRSPGQNRGRAGSGWAVMERHAGREPPERESLRRWDPERIGPYVVLGRLGSGSMGQVYLGRSAAGRLVAVKTIRVELAEEAGFRHRFAQEVMAARKVSAVFTAAVVEADPEADLPWLATAYVPAPSLARLVAACGPLPVTTVRWLAAGCAEALASIHGVGLVHRDLKPSNVLVAPDGPRVIDFGVARAAERMGLTTARGAVGTPAYMAPEQARDTREASVASDIYSLGATLLFAATEHLPYQGATVMDVLVQLATEEPDLSGLPDELTGLVTACMARAPRQRPTSSAILAQLGDFTVAQVGPDEEHPYLPEAAMALIGDYVYRPQLVGLSNTSDEDWTVSSYPDLPASGVRRNKDKNPKGRFSTIFKRSTS